MAAVAQAAAPRCRSKNGPFEGDAPSGTEKTRWSVDYEHPVGFRQSKMFQGMLNMALFLGAGTTSAHVVGPAISCDVSNATYNPMQTSPVKKTSCRTFAAEAA